VSATRPSRDPEHDPLGVACVIADSGIWTPVHLAIVLGIFLMLGGYFGSPISGFSL
jgi:hypothetical protein